MSDNRLLDALTCRGVLASVSVIRAKHFANRVFDSPDAVTAQASSARAAWAGLPDAVQAWSSRRPFGTPVG